MPCFVASGSVFGTEYHVSPKGNDANDGAPSAMLRTISAAALRARPGDIVTVHQGIYRERVNPPRGGTSDARRIVYRAAPGERVVIKGSEVVKGWRHAGHDTWVVTLPDTFFGAFNPFADRIQGDWFNPRGRTHHTGAVYRDGHWLTEAPRLDDVLKPAADAPLWYAQTGGTNNNGTTIWAQFPEVDPNQAEVEINVRQSVFYPEQPGIHYLTVRGFILEHAATPWAPPTAEQIGLVGTHWSKGWIIEDNTIRYSTCVGVTLGKYGDRWDNTSQNAAEGYVKTIERALANGWSGEQIGRHVVRNNRISHCEQAGLVGSLGAVFSTISGNEIHDIHVRRLFTGAEMAGIKIHAAVDTEIRGNHIYRTARGIWLDWMTQGTRVTRNVLHDNGPTEDLYVEVNHGPFMVDHNLFLSPHALLDMSEGGAYAHNLFAGQVVHRPELGRSTPFLEPHATGVAGYQTTAGGDDRFYNNVFVHPAGLAAYDRATLPVNMGGNVFLRGAAASRHEEAPLTFGDFDPDVRLKDRSGSMHVDIVLDPSWATTPRRLVTTELLGRAAVPDLPYVQPNRTPYQLDNDFHGKERNVSRPFPGPFEVGNGGRRSFNVWPLDAPRGRRGATAVIAPSNPDGRPLVDFAAREVQRYVYLRTGELLPIVQSRPEEGVFIGLAVDPGLADDGYRLRGDAGGLLISGGSETALLYGAYHFAEKLGVRFYVHGDVIPDVRVPLKLPRLDETHEPLFEHRGIQPFHDFTEGPDWWSLDDYKTYIGQLPKLRMNWIGFHCYPEGGVGPEPLVWIGLPEDVNEDGTVKWAYPSRWASTSGGTFGYGTAKTSDFAAGAGLLFPSDDFGAEIMKGLLPRPEGPEDSAALFNRAGRFMDKAFRYAERLGIHTVIGTETPLMIPSALQERLREKGLDPKAPDTVRKLYEGMFLRINRAHPLGTYWLWTPENWTWGANSKAALEATVDDFRAAMGARDALGQPFGFGTCGWVLGPSRDRALFDRTLSADVAMACINRQVGFSPIEAGFARIRGRPQWAIPWVEDDPAMIIPQLWAGRMRRDAADAYAYGCTGLLGIHWRTKILSPNFAALAAAAWDQQGWNPEAGVRIDPPEGPENDYRIGGRAAAYDSPIEATGEDTIYRCCRYDVDGYQVRVPDGAYTVTLKFCEVAYDQPGKRVFGVAVQGETVADHLDVFARVGKNVAHDIVVPDVRVENETLEIAFTREVEFPFIAAIAITGTTAAANQVAGEAFARRINCGGGAHDGYEADLPGADAVPVQRNLPRDLPVDDFYLDWCTAHFGSAAAGELATLFARLDGGGPDSVGGSTRGANLPRPATWIAGPGGITANRAPWERERARYAFVEEMAALRPTVRGAGNRARFDYWLNAFRYLRAVGRIGCTRGALDEAMERLADAPGTDRPARAHEALAIREQLARDWEELLTLQLAATDTVGGMGTIANLEQHVRRNPLDGGRHRFLDVHDQALAAALGGPLPDTVRPTTRYLGAPRLVVPTARTSRDGNEILELRMIVLDREQPRSVHLYWRKLGADAFRKVAARRIGRAVYRADLPPADGHSVEYYVGAETAEGVTLRWPADAPEINQTVVAMPRS